MQLQRQSIVPLISDSVQLVQHQLDRCNCRLELDLGEDGMEVDCDAAKLKQALVALLINSCNAVSAGDGGIGIRCRRLPDNKVAIAVSDNGPGMDEATKARIFEPFFTTKLENLKEDSGYNIGLGLTVVEEIIRLHHGEIEVESEPGKGTTMILILPLAEGN
ncbi:MAG: ATP-binding protein, partial [Deltaproteobacteria bacterium]